METALSTGEISLVVNTAWTNNINNIINQNKISFKKITENTKLVDFNGYSLKNFKANNNFFDNYSFSKYTTKDILFNPCNHKKLYFLKVNIFSFKQKIYIKKVAE